MFDDQPASGGAQAPNNLPVEPEDMFADIDPPAQGQAAAVAPSTGAPNALSAGLLKPKTAAPAQQPVMEPPRVAAMPETEMHEPPVTQTYDTRSPVIGKIIVAVASLVVLGLMGFGGWWLYGRLFAKTPAAQTNTQTQTTPTPTPTPEPPPQPTPPTNQTTDQTQNTVSGQKTDEILFGDRKDSDNDGLDDATEAKLSTDQANADTDSDGLCDGDEVISWRTDPKKPDTDGDNHKDSTEVFNGYSPIGPGKLGPLPDGVTTSTACQSAKK